MNDQPGPPPIIETAPPEATVTRRRTISIIWAIPVVTILVGAYLAWDTYARRGPTITILFDSGVGLTAGTSQIKYKDIVFGTVSKIELTSDLNHVTVTAQMTREATPLLTDQTRFWVVKPRLFAGNVQGLDTLLSGSYVALLPSPNGTKAATSFTGLDDPPVLTTDVPGTTFLLKANRLNAVSLGSPVFYRDLEVGQVLGWDLGDMADTVTIHAFVRSPFDKYVHEQSRFWNASGLSVKLGADGIQVQVDSLKSIILGGIAFETPKDARNTALAQRDRVFPLFASQDAANDADFTRQVPMLAYFPGSVDGLAIGAPVTFKGIKIGEVTGIALKYQPELDTIAIPVTFFIEPQRIGNVGAVAADRGPLANLTMLVAKGLRAQLKSSNLLTGQMAVAIDIEPDAPPALLRVENGVFVIPTTEGGLAGITKSVNDLLSKINRLPFEQLGKTLNQTLASVDSLASGPELQSAVKALQGTLVAVQDVARRLDAGLSPALRRLPDIAAGLETTINRTGKLVSGIDAGYGAGSAVNRDLARILVELNDTARSIRVLADLLTRHPEALVRGRTNTGPQ